MPMRIRQATLAAIALVATVSSACWAAKPALNDVLDDLYGLENLEPVVAAPSIPAQELTWAQAGSDPIAVKARAKSAQLALAMGLIDGPVTDENVQVLLEQTGLAVDYHVAFDSPLIGQLGLEDPRGTFRLFLQTVSGNAKRPVEVDSRILAYRVAVAPAGWENNVLGSYVLAFEPPTVDIGRDIIKWDSTDAIFELSGIELVGSPMAPEPATLALLLAGVASLWMRRRRR